MVERVTSEFPPHVTGVLYSLRITMTRPLLWEPLWLMRWAITWAWTTMTRAAAPVLETAASWLQHSGEKSHTYSYMLD